MSARASKSPKRDETNDPAAVDAFLAKLDHPLKPALAALREVILGAGAGATEGIKWNAPSFYQRGWFATTNVRKPDELLLVLHLGAKVREVSGLAESIEDPAGLLAWLGRDRAVVRFSSLADVQAKAPALTALVRAWVRHMA